MSHHPEAILTWPKYAHILRQKSKPVPVETLPALQGFIDQLVASMYAGNGYGLSAIQIGNDLQIFVLDAGKGPEVFVNPVIVDMPGVVELMHEGCLSFPGMWDDVERVNAVHVRYLDRHGIEHDEIRTGSDAQCIQHEMEHFEGKLLSDGLSPLKRSRWASKLK